MLRLSLLSCALLGLVVPLRAADTETPAKGVVVNKTDRTITIDCKIAPRKLDDEKYQGKIYPIEVIACWPYPKGQKAHETVVTIEAKPSAVHKALVDLGLKPGQPVMGESKTPPQGPEVNLFIEAAGPDGQPR